MDIKLPCVTFPEAELTKSKLYNELEICAKKEAGKNVILYSGGLDCFVLAFYLASINITFELLHVMHKSVPSAETKAAKRAAKLLHSKLNIVELSVYDDTFDMSPTFLTYISIAESIFHSTPRTRLLLGIIRDDHTGKIIQGTSSYLFRVTNLLRLHGSSLLIETPFDQWSKQDVLGLAHELNFPLQICSPCEEWSEHCECSICNYFMKKYSL